jgi:transcriptional regulator with XRE-family HTH domain
LNPIYDAELHVGARLVAARQLRNVTQEELAEKLGISPEDVENHEQGLTQLSAGRLYEVAQALGVDVSYFYEGLGEAPPSARSLTVALTDERYAMLQRAVLRIAADYELTQTGHRKRLARHEAINVAREVCEALGWNYGFTRAVQPRIAQIALATADEH